MKILSPEKPTVADLRRYFLFAAFKMGQGQEYMERQEVLLGENPSPQFYIHATRLRQVDREGFLVLDRAIDPWTKPNGGPVHKTYLFQCAPDNKSGCGHTNLLFERTVSVAGEEQSCESCPDLTPYDKIPAIVWDVEHLFTTPAFSESEVELNLWFNYKAHYQVARGHARFSDEFVAEYLEYLGGKITKADKGQNGVSFTTRIPLSHLHRMNGTDRLVATAEIKDFSGKAQELVLMDL